MVELLQALPLSREIIQALLNHEGSKGRILRAAIAYERGDFGELDNLPPTRVPLSDLYADAVACDRGVGLPGGGVARASREDAARPARPWRWPHNHRSMCPPSRLASLGGSRTGGVDGFSRPAPPRTGCPRCFSRDATLSRSRNFAALAPSKRAA